MSRRNESANAADSREAGLPLPARSLGYHLRQLSESWSSLMKTMLDAHGLTEGQWRYLRELWGNEGLTQRELGERTGRQGPSTLAALRLLERSGLATIAAADHDRRKTVVRLTRRGRELRGKLAAIVEEVEALGMAGLTAAEIATFKRLTVKIQRNLDKHGSRRNHWAVQRTEALAREVGL